MALKAGPILLALIFAGAALAAAQLQREQQRTLVLYTTPALQGLLEQDILPRFEARTGLHVEPVYVAAGEQYNRLRMSGLTPEADLFLHASPLYIEKGYQDGYFQPFDVPDVRSGANDTFRSRLVATQEGAGAAYGSGGGGRVWYAFAWSPLVEVYAPRFDQPPDLATADVTFGVAHPLLSNNGVYNVLYYETLDKDAGRYALARTTVQPTNARATINGIADGSFDVTLGYEAVALYYQEKGAKIKADLPVLHGERAVVPVLITVGLVKAHQHPDAARFIEFLFADETQARLAKSYFRPVRPVDDALPRGAVDVSGVRVATYDWSRWSELEARLKDYEVKS